jgi:hypothetical protein
MRCVRCLIALALVAVGEVAEFVRTMLRSRTSLVAENLFCESSWPSTKNTNLGIPKEAYRGATRRCAAQLSLQKKAQVISPILGGLHHEYGWEEMAA